MPSPSPHFTTFAVAGGLGKGPFGANLGQCLARALIKEGAKVVRILGRAGASASVGAKELSALGIKIVEVDYNSPSSLAFALEGIDVVLSTLAGEGWAAQLPLALAGKKAGVQLFVPSEYGPIIEDGIGTDSPFWPKIAGYQQMRDAGVALLRVRCGLFANWVNLCINVDADSEILIVGSGDALISWTSRDDVADFLGHILTHLPPSHLLTLDPLALEASVTSLNTIAALLLEANPGAKVVHKSYEWAQEQGDQWSRLKLSWDQGKARSYDVRRGAKELGNGLWEEWKPRGVEEYVGREEGREE